MKRPVRKKQLRLHAKDQDGRKELVRLTRLEITRQKKAGEHLWRIRSYQALNIMKEQLNWLLEDVESWDDGKLEDLQQWLTKPAELQMQHMVFKQLEDWLLLKGLLHRADWMRGLHPHPQALQFLLFLCWAGIDF